MSSSHHHHGETKGQRNARRILAFFLFLVISLLALTVCIRISFVSKSAVISTMTSDTYVQGVTRRAVTYAHDLCDECSLPYDSVDETVNFDSIYGVQKAYHNGLLNASDEFTESTYQDYISNIGKELKASTLTMIEDKNIKTDGDAEKLTAAFVNKITAYITEITELSFTQQLVAVVSFGSIASVIAAAALALVALVLVLIIISIGSKQYRALRDIVFALFAAALLNLLLPFGVDIVKHFKTLVFYPRYLSDAIMEYVNNCLVCVRLSAVILFVAGLVLSAVLWSMKKSDNS